MIKNENQYEVSKQKAREFKAALADVDMVKPIMHPIQYRVYVEALTSQYETLLAEIAEYEGSATK